MKRSKKLIVTLVSAIIMIAMVAFTACGAEEKPDAKINGSYTSTANVAFFSAYPAYTFKQATFSVQNLKTFDDNTYCLIVTNVSFSGSLLFPDTGAHSATPRGGSVVTYYGEFTSLLEEGLMTVTLKTPTRVIYDNQAGAQGTSYSVDTANWTNEMGLAIAPAPAEGAEKVALTAVEYLAKVAFVETSVIVSTETFSFDFTKLTVPTPAV